MRDTVKHPNRGKYLWLKKGLPELLPEEYQEMREKCYAAPQASIPVLSLAPLTRRSESRRQYHGRG